MLDDVVLRAYKRRAADRGTTLASEIEDTLRAALLQRSAERISEPFELVTVDGESARPGLDYTSNVELLDTVDREAPPG